MFCRPIIQNDQKVSVHLKITIQKSGVQRLFDHPVLCVLNCSTETRAANTFLEGCTWPVGRMLVDRDIYHQIV
jgi:hypothetical protein